MYIVAHVKTMALVHFYLRFSRSSVCLYKVLFGHFTYRDIFLGCGYVWIYFMIFVTAEHCIQLFSYILVNYECHLHLYMITFFEIS